MTIKPRNSRENSSETSFGQSLERFAQQCVESGMSFDRILMSYNKAVLMNQHNKQVIGRN